MVATRHTRQLAAAAGIPPTPPQALPPTRVRRAPKLANRKTASPAIEQAAATADSEEQTSTSNPDAVTQTSASTSTTIAPIAAAHVSPFTFTRSPNFPLHVSPPTSASIPIVAQNTSSPARALVHIWLKPTKTTLASEKVPRAAPEVKVVVPLSAIQDFLNSFAQQPEKHIDNSALSPVTSRKRKFTGPAESSNSANKRAKIMPLPPTSDCNETHQSTDEELAVVAQPRDRESVPRPMRIERARQAESRRQYTPESAESLEDARARRRRTALWRMITNPTGMVEDAVRARKAAEQKLLLTKCSCEDKGTTQSASTTSQASTAPVMETTAIRETQSSSKVPVQSQPQTLPPNEPLQAPHRNRSVPRYLSLKKVTTEGTSTTSEESTAPAMGNTAVHESQPSFEVPVQNQPQTLPPDEPLQAPRTNRSVPRFHSLKDFIIESVSKYVPAFSRAPLSPTSEKWTTSNVPQTGTPQADAAFEFAAVASESLKAKKSSHKSAEQRKAMSKRKKAELSAERKEAAILAAKEREIQDEVARRVNLEMKAQEAAWKLSHPGEKRKRYSPDTIPSPAGTSYGMDLDFFPNVSDDDEDPASAPESAPEPVSESAPESPCLRAAKRVRLNEAGNTIRIFRRDEIIGHRSHSQPYTGSMFADPPERIMVGKPTPALSNRPRKILKVIKPSAQAQPPSDDSPTNHSGTFTVPYSPDSEEDNGEPLQPVLSLIDNGKAKATDQLPHLTSMSSKTDNSFSSMPESERLALIRGEYTRIYEALKDDTWGRDRSKELLNADTRVRLNTFIRKRWPEMVGKPLDLENPVRLPLNNQPESESLAKARQKATQYSPKRPSALGSNVRVYEPDDSVASMSKENGTRVATPATGNATKPLRGILKATSGNALREVGRNMASKIVVEPQNSEKENRAYHESYIDNSSAEQLGNGNEDVSSEMEIDSPFNFQQSTIDFDPKITNLVDEKFSEADREFAIGYVARSLDKFLAKQPSRTMN